MELQYEHIKRSYYNSMIKHEKKQDFSTSISETSENAYLFLFHDWFPFEFVFIYSTVFI